jgi:hypothetical protein
MSWEIVKGFCRRQTQTFKETFRHASKTEDTECDQLVQEAQKITGQVQRMGSRLKNFCAEISNIVQQFEATRDDLAGSTSEDISSNCKRIDLAAIDLRQKQHDLERGIEEQLAQMTKFCSESSQLSSLIEDRKTKMLEFDFFRNKVAELRANPPSDSSRIPRNEGRVNEWKAAYEESTSRLKRFCNVTIEGGQRLLIFGTQALMTESGKFFLEASKTTRAILLGTKMSEHASKALEAVQQTVASNSAPAIAPVVQHSAAPSSKRFLGDDDPFRL